MVVSMRSSIRAWWHRLAIGNPVAVFYVLRFTTWALAVSVLIAQSAPAANLRFGEGLVLYTFLHLSLGTLYAVVLHPRLARANVGFARTTPPVDLMAVGVLDIAAGLAVVYFSGGWGSPFWHFAITSIMVPCFLVTFPYAMVVATVYAGLYVVAIVLGGDGLDGAWVGGQRHLFAGFLTTIYLVGITVSYLGRVFRALDVERLRARSALDDLETLFDVTRNVISAASAAESLALQVAQTVRGRQRYSAFAIYLQEPEASTLRLAASTVGVEDLGEPAVVAAGQGLIGGAASRRVTRTTDGPQWSAAVPLQAGGHLLGVMLVRSRGQVRNVAAATGFAEALARQVAVGIHNTHLSRQQAELAAREERTRIAREIHDGIAQAMYALSLNLETCADLAEREKGPLRERLRGLVPLARQTLLETRHYIHDLGPLLSGERDLAAVAENLVGEFAAIAGIPAHLTAQGDPPEVSVGVATGLYRIIQESLANVLKHARASEVNVALSFGDRDVRLVVQDDGAGFEPDAARHGYGLENMRQRAEELGGSLEISSAPGTGTRVSVSLPAQEA